MLVRLGKLKNGMVLHRFETQGIKRLNEISIPDSNRLPDVLVLTRDYSTSAMTQTQEKDIDESTLRFNLFCCAYLKYAHSTRTENGRSLANAHCTYSFSEALLFERSVTSTAIYSSHVLLGGGASCLFQCWGKALHVENRGLIVLGLLQILSASVMLSTI